MTESSAVRAPRTTRSAYGLRASSRATTGAEELSRGAPDAERYAVGRADGCRPYVAGFAVIVVGLSSILLAGWLAALLVIAGSAIFCAGIAAEERGYRE